MDAPYFIISCEEIASPSKNDGSPKNRGRCRNDIRIKTTATPLRWSAIGTKLRASVARAAGTGFSKFMNLCNTQYNANIGLDW